MKVSFDFDNTLSRRAVQKFAKELIKKGYEVHIVTSRFEDCYRYSDPRIVETGHRDLFRVCFYLNIPKSNIHFTNMEDKCVFFQTNSDFLFHLDDDYQEIIGMNTYSPVKGVLCDKGMNWKKELEKHLL